MQEQKAEFGAPPAVSAAMQFAGYGEDMKRVLTGSLACAVCVVCTACGGSGEAATLPRKLNQPFSTHISMQLGDLDASAMVQYHGGSSWDVEFSEPNTLAGVKLTFLDNTVTASFKGLEFSVPQSALPVKSMITMLFTVVEDAASQEKLSCVKKEGLYLVEGELPEGAYTLTLNEAGEPVMFAMPNQGLSIEFSDFTLSPQGSESAPPADTQPTTPATEPVPTESAPQS